MSWHLPECEDTANSQQNATQRVRYLPVPDHAGILILNIQPPELWEINVCCLLATQSMVVFYGNLRASQIALVVKNLPGNTGDVRNSGLSPGSWGSPGGGLGNPLQCSCLDNSVDRGAWWATVLRAAKSRTRLKWLSMHTQSTQVKYIKLYIYIYIYIKFQLPSFLLY